MSTTAEIMRQFAPVATCDRVMFSKVKRGPKALQFCNWCKAFLRPANECPVAALSTQRGVGK